MSVTKDPDQPKTAVRRPKRPGIRNTSSTAQQRLLKRRAIALGMGIVFLFLMVVAVRGCLDARKKSSLKEYTRSVSSLVLESDKQIGEPFFALMAQRDGQSPQDLQTNISGFKVTANTQLKQAEKISVPKDMQAAQRSLLDALEFRRNGLAAIAAQIRSALSDNPDAADAAIEQITAQMQSFLASDVIYQGRVAPIMKSALDKAGLGGQQLPKSHFLPGVEWLSTTTVAANLGVKASKKPKMGEPPAPGLHGTALQTVTAGSVQLKAGEANRLPASTKSFIVKFINQGDHDEFDLKTTLTIEGTDKPIKVQKVVDTIAKGAVAEVQLDLKTAPPTGNPVKIKVAVDAVPGEKNVDNNKTEYSVLFTQG